MSKAAPAQSINFEISLAHPSVLIIDDERDFLERTRNFFKFRKYDVDVARTPEEAMPYLIEHAQNPKYRIIITDDNFKKLSRKKGHQFILENQKLLGEAKALIVSGAEHPSAETLAQLQEVGARYIEKNDSLEGILKEVTKGDREEQEKFVKEKVADNLADLPKSAGGPALVAIKPAPAQSPRPFSEEALSTLKQIIINWLETRGDLNTPALAYGERVYSANEMIQEVENETEVGRDHVMMLLAEFGYSQEINEDDPPNNEDDTEHAGFR
jgi:ActR/RegA family two-component response regulator